VYSGIRINGTEQKDLEMSSTSDFTICNPSGQAYLNATDYVEAFVNWVASTDTAFKGLSVARIG
jgi:hypothetical protein